MDLGKLFFEARKKRGFNQDQFSNQLGIDKTYLSQLENNKKTPSIKLLEKISEVTQIPLAVLLFSSISIEDIPDEKKELYRILFPKIRDMFYDIFQQPSN